MSSVRKLIKWLPVLLFVIITLIIIADYRVQVKTNSLVYTDISAVPHNKAGLLLGTSRQLRSGAPNQYFINRITAASALYHAGKIDYIVISGDNRSIYYNEPRDMKKALLSEGVPAEKIFLDYAGFRTFDSVIRMKEIFGQEKFTIISQDFHTRRALYIANSRSIQAIGFCAADVNMYNGFKTKLREKFARVRLFADLTFGREPKFLGEKINLPADSVQTIN